MFVTSKSGTSRTGWFPVLLIFLFFTPIACWQPTEEQLKQRRFGDSYEILFGSSSSLSETPPLIDGDTLKVHLAYTGGCGTHDFDADYEIKADTTFLWINHVAHDDSCEEYVRDFFEAGLDQKALSSPTIVLLNPQGDVPIILRWGSAP
jgi:hypothetical protein